MRGRLTVAVFAAVVPVGAQMAAAGEPLAEGSLAQTHPVCRVMSSALKGAVVADDPPSGGPLVRLRFERVEVVLTLAEFASLSADVRRLWDFLRRAPARQP